MRPFALRARRPTPRAPSPCSPTRAGGALPRRRDEPRRPHEARRRAARRCSSTSPACRYDRIERARRRRPAHRRRRAQQPTWPPTGRPRALSRARPGAARRRVRPAAQHGDGRRQPAAAHALRLLPGRHEAVQQARGRAPAARRARATTATSRSWAHSEACVATHPSDMAVALAALDAIVHVEGRDGERAIPHAGLHRLPGDEPQRDTVLRTGELITAVELPPLAFARALALPQGARPRVLRLRARLGGRRARRRATASCATAASRSAAWRTSRGARVRAEEALRGAPATEEAFGAAADAELAEAAAAAATTRSRCRSRATSSSARCSTSRREARR